MVVWCRICGALMGVREPYTDWSVDRNALCPRCAASEHLITVDESMSLAEKDDNPVAAGAAE